MSSVRSSLAIPNSSRAVCRFCAAPLSTTFVDLGMSPLCQTHIEPQELNHMERFYPLHAWVCGKCYLVQLEEYVSPDQIFQRLRVFFVVFGQLGRACAALRGGDDRAPQLGRRTRSSWRSPATTVICCSTSSRAAFPCRGIEPAANVAEAAVAKGIPTTVKFFGRKTATEVAEQYGRADLLLGNNVLAHVPDINDFVGGMQILLKPRRRDHDGIPAPAEAHGRESVRHDLPRAFLVLVLRNRREGSSRITGCACSTWKRYPRTAVRCASMGVTPRTRRTRVRRR